MLYLFHKNHREVLLFCALEQFLQHQCPMAFEGLIGFSCETIWAWSFVRGSSLISFSVSSIEIGMFKLSDFTGSILVNHFIQDLNLFA